MKTVNFEINLPEFNLNKLNRSLYDDFDQVQKLIDTVNDLNHYYV